MSRSFPFYAICWMLNVFLGRYYKCVLFIKTRIKQHRYVVLFKNGFRIFSNIKTWFILNENGLE